MFTPRFRVLYPLVALVAAACPSPPPGGGGALELPTDPGGGTGSLVVQNPTEETWDLVVNGQPKGSVGPRAEATIPRMRVGLATVVAKNDALVLEQRGDVQVRLGRATTYALKVLVTRLEVENPHATPVEIVIDGVVVGHAAAHSKTVFEAVPAGKRVLVARATSGPAAVRVEQRLAPGGSTAWVVPALAEAPAEFTLPTPPNGMGLVRMKNASRYPVSVFADGIDKGLVAPGATFDIVLVPGTHKLEVKIEGIEAKTEHTVTLQANQAASWVWGAESP